MLTQKERNLFKELIDLASENARGNWEVEFVEGLEDSFDDPFFDPSEKQWEKVQEIAGRESWDWF